MINKVKEIETTRIKLKRIPLYLICRHAINGNEKS